MKNLASEAITLVRQQPALDRDRVAGCHAHESAERTLAADNAVAGDDERDRIRATGATDRARRRVQTTRQLAVGSRLADRNRGECVPDATPERRARRRERERESP